VVRGGFLVTPLLRRHEAPSASADALVTADEQLVGDYSTSAPPLHILQRLNWLHKNPLMMAATIRELRGKIKREYKFHA